MMTPVSASPRVSYKSLAVPGTHLCQSPSAAPVPGQGEGTPKATAQHFPTYLASPFWSAQTPSAAAHWEPSVCRSCFAAARSPPCLFPRPPAPRPGSSLAGLCVPLSALLCRCSWLASRALGLLLPAPHSHHSPCPASWTACSRCLTPGSLYHLLRTRS